MFITGAASGMGEAAARLFADPEFQAKLDWADRFMREHVEALDYVLPSPYEVKTPLYKKLVRPLQEEVKKQELWNCHLGPELGGKGYGQLKLGLLNEILGRSKYGPTVFGTQAPDSGNAEILAHYGTPEQKKRWLEPLLANEIVSCFSMTEPQGGADPLQFTCAARREGDEWVISGEKFFSSHANFADFLIAMVVTNPDAPPYERLSMIVVPADALGLETIRLSAYGDEKLPSHAYLRYNDVRVPLDHMLGGEGQGFAVAQTRLGGGRIHHAMRTIGLAKKAFDMMCERALARTTQGSLLSEKQMLQEKIADSWLEIEQFRLLVLRTAWLIDKYQDYRRVRRDISAIKVAMPRVLHAVASRALHVHGCYGLSDEAPFMGMIADAFMIGLADGPTEVHQLIVAKLSLGEHSPATTHFPGSYPLLRRAAAEKLGIVDDLYAAVA